MPMADWIHKYPGVAALLQGKRERLQYAPDAQEARQAAAPDAHARTEGSPPPAYVSSFLERIGRELPFVLHVHMERTTSFALRLELKCEEGVEVDERIDIQLLAERGGFADACLDHIRHRIIRAVSERQVQRWQASKQGESFLALFTDAKGFTHQMALPLEHGQPAQHQRFHEATRMPVAPFWVQDTPPTTHIYREAVFVLENYNPLTRVAWYRPA